MKHPNALRLSLLALSVALASAPILGRAAPVPTENTVASYQKAAEAGDAEAMLKLAVAYRDGKGIKHDNGLFAFWCGKAAQLGNPDAMYQLAEMYDNGYRVSEDRVKAFQWYKMAADAGHIDSMVRLASIYFYSDEGIEKDVAKAVMWYKKAADLGSPDAMYGLGVAYKKGQGVPKNEAQALSWYKSASEKGHPVALRELASAYRTGFGGLQQNFKMAESLDAQYHKLDFFGEKFKVTSQVQVFEVYKLAAQKGDITAMEAVAFGYETGQGAKKNNKMAEEIGRAHV